MEVSAVLLVTSVENVTKSATDTNIQKSGRFEMKLNFPAMSAASPVDEKDCFYFLTNYMKKLQLY